MCEFSTGDKSLKVKREVSRALLPSENIVASDVIRDLLPHHQCGHKKSEMSTMTRTFMLTEQGKYA